ncbi:TOX high mobility group box family member 4-A-like isoform X1 [Diabrotica virgifera virgifera]|uniref:HMG box domain-containing protein n=3 Tax=Diabrotica virgifera virgifera TaxID=50390 RepID=A0ABM5JZB7_DIAVI|nr:TOX high mobility group box family member 4-A-like isoform X1 [Diabrotica virgifera virgifera]
MEATYCVGTDVDVCRMFDQYLYKRSENVDLSLSIPQSNFQSNGYDMGDQTFHTPSFGDEEFDIPAINPQQQQQQGHSDQQHYQPPMQGMQQMNQQINQQQDALGMHDPTGGFQQPLYLSGPDHSMVNNSYHSPQPNYPSPQQQQQHNNQLLMIQQQQQQQQHHQQQQQQHHQQMMMSHGQPPPSAMGQYGASPQHPQGRGNSPPAPGQEPTTSDDSDDSTPHPAIITAMKRPSPEPADQTLTKAQKKPKVQKKKKKRDPNEPQKPVSAYALFFRDTQAAIKGQNPNASFGEVSKIVASMWDALDSEHKNVYKKKTEAAKKEYLKALAAYRASLVSKGAGENEGMYSNYPNYQGGAPQQYSSYQPQGTIPSPPMSAPPSATPPAQSPIGKKPPMMGGMPQSPQQGHQGMMQPGMGPVPNHMNMQQHMQQSQQHNSYMQQFIRFSTQVPQQQHVPMSPQQQQPHVSVSPHSHMQQQSPHMQQHMSPPPMVSSSPPVSAPAPSIPTSVSQPNVGQGPGMRPQNACIRHGCPNPAITNPEWEDEYCSNECVVSHCRDVFTDWVSANKNQSQNFSTVK